MRYIRIFAEQCKLSVMSAAMYRTNFWLMLIQSCVNAAMGILCVEFIYGSVTHIAGWGKHEMLVLVCTAMVINQIYRNFIHWNQNRFIAAVGSGGFDKMLLRPLGLMFQVNTGRVDISGVISASAPFTVLIMQTIASGARVTPAGVALFLLLTLNGMLILASFMLLLYASVFVFVKVDGIDNIYYIVMGIAEKPREMFSRGFFYAFLFFIPAMPIANAPTSALLGRADPVLLIVSACIGPVFAAAAYAAVRLGLRRYASASG